MLEPDTSSTGRRPTLNILRLCLDDGGRQRHTGFSSHVNKPLLILCLLMSIKGSVHPIYKTSYFLSSLWWNLSRFSLFCLQRRTTAMKGKYVFVVLVNKLFKGPVWHLRKPSHYRTRYNVNQTWRCWKVDFQYNVVMQKYSTKKKKKKKRSFNKPQKNVFHHKSFPVNTITNFTGLYVKVLWWRLNRTCCTAAVYNTLFTWEDHLGLPWWRYPGDVTMVTLPWWRGGLVTCSVSLFPRFPSPLYCY